MRQVASATYHQVWWPRHDKVVYDDSLPVWTSGEGSWTRTSGVALPTWDDALRAIDEDTDAEPAHVLRFGGQVDLQGIIATEDDADRRVAYLTKYLTKSISETCGTDEELSPAQRMHMRRLQEQIRFLPCSPRCWNWLRYGVQPAGREDGMVPGSCPAKAHDPENLGCGGRRVLVSRKWTGKTLERPSRRPGRGRPPGALVGRDRRARRAAARRRHQARGRLPRFTWKIWDPLDSTVPMYRSVMTRAVAERMRWKAEYANAKATSSTVQKPP